MDSKKVKEGEEVWYLIDSIHGNLALIYNNVFTEANP